MTGLDMEENAAQLAETESDKLQGQSNEISEKQLDMGTAPMVWKKRKGIWLIIAMALCLSTGLGGGYLRWQANNRNISNNGEVREVYRFPVLKEQLLMFKSFVIPLKQNMKFTYMSMSISVNVLDKNVKKEVEEKEDQLRGIIYDSLKEEIDRSNEAPSLDRLKHVIETVTNKALSSEKVRGVFITEFLCV